MEFSMMGQEKGDCLIEVAAWVGLTVSTLYVKRSRKLCIYNYI